MFKNRIVSCADFVRLVARMMPPHRKDWADAILNELAYIESRRAIICWLIESTVFVVKARIAYELEKTFMNGRIFKAIIVLVAVSVSAVAGTYAIQKPYQQERIKLTLQRLLDVTRT